MSRDEQPTLEIVVDPPSAGRRLDQFLAAPVGSRAQAARLIEQGAVLVDGRPVPKRHALAAGERVEVRPLAPRTAAPDAVAVEFTVAYEDEHLLVVDKPAGLVVHPARGHWSGTLAQALAGRAAGGEDEARTGIVHRLDRDTSGLLVVAKSELVHRRLKQLLAARELHREYAALVDGVPPARTGTIDAPIGRHPRDRVSMSVGGSRRRDARTHFEVVEVLGDAALLRVALETGRTHQIRVHLAAIGHPVCGDRQYGGSRRFALERQFLHAARLTFPHPQTGALLDVRSDLPPELQAALAAARAGRRPDHA